MDALDARAPKNVVVVATANKWARIAWAVLSSGEEYRPIAAHGTAASASATALIERFAVFPPRSAQE